MTGQPRTGCRRVITKRRPGIDATPAPGVDKSAMPNPQPITDAAGVVRLEPCYDAAELAALLGASERTVRRRVSAGLWPYVRGKRGRILFTREHVRVIVRAFNETHDYPAHEPGREA